MSTLNIKQHNQMWAFNLKHPCIGWLQLNHSWPSWLAVSKCRHFELKAIAFLGRAEIYPIGAHLVLSGNDKRGRCINAPPTTVAPFEPEQIDPIKALEKQIFVGVSFLKHEHANLLKQQWPVVSKLLWI